MHIENFITFQLSLLNTCSPTSCTETPFLTRVCTQVIYKGISCGFLTFLQNERNGHRCVCVVYMKCMLCVCIVCKYTLQCVYRSYFPIFIFFPSVQLGHFTHLSLYSTVGVQTAGILLTVPTPVSWLLLTQQCQDHSS